MKYKLVYTQRAIKDIRMLESRGGIVKNELGKHFLNISIVFLGGMFFQAISKEDWKTSLIALGFSVLFTCLGAAILARQED